VRKGKVAFDNDEYEEEYDYDEEEEGASAPAQQDDDEVVIHESNLEGRKIVQSQSFKPHLANSLQSPAPRVVASLAPQKSVTTASTHSNVRPASHQFQPGATSVQLSNEAIDEIKENQM
jgi:hypothetical protein